MKALRFILLIPAFAGPTLAESPDDIRSLSGAGTDPDVDRVTFSDRAQLDPKLEKYLERAPRFLGDWEAILELPPPPANSSPRTRAELAWLRDLEARRTEAQIAAIRKQIEVAGMSLGPHEMGVLLGTGSPHPAWREMLSAAQRDMETIVFRLKRKFDRARPTHLDAGLAPCIVVPGHPAYPSGHATQAHLLAFFLAELDPDHADEILRDAAQIARNREIAGVHYPGDSEAGALLARQIVDRLLEREEFLVLWEAARRE